jgi:UDP-N-acetylmuramyl pentapeptide phosphotransferase/UDP-N-acetylglucosamine-1-phosphate transferase
MHAVATCALVTMASRLLGSRLAALQSRAGLVAGNWRGRSIPRALGVALLPPAVVAAALLLPRGDALGLLAGSCALGWAGLLDDVASAGEPRGWSGHARALWRGQLTCGGLKAVAGVAAAWAVLGAAPAAWALGALLPNALNSLDTRPGRAIGAYLAATALLLALDRPAGLRALPFAAAALGLWPTDLREQAMLGDTGANALGFALAYAVAATPPAAAAAVAAAALALIVVGDRISLGALAPGRLRAARPR